MTENAEPGHLRRGMGLLPATATTIIGMVGVGPFLVIPFMITSMGGPHILYAWIAGDVLAFADGLVYSHFGAALPLDDFALRAIALDLRRVGPGVVPAVLVHRVTRSPILITSRGTWATPTIRRK